MSRHKGGSVNVSIRIPKITRDQLTVEATRRGLTLGTFLRTVLMDYAPDTKVLGITYLSPVVRNERN